MMLTRHYKGEYFAVQTLTAKEAGKDVVVFESLQNDEVFVVPLHEFLAEVKDDDNPTGQKYQYERVSDIKAMGLDTATTQALVDELNLRQDNPFPETTSEILWSVYQIGYLDQEYIHSDLTVDRFTALYSSEDLEDTINYYRKMDDARAIIIRQMTVKQPLK